MVSVGEVELKWLNCNGSIGFDNVNRNNITIRARGTLGGEHLNLRINNAVVANFTLSTTFQNYTATFNTAGAITVEYDNDRANSDVVVGLHSGKWVDTTG